MKGQAEESGSGKTNRVVRDLITTYLLECADLHTYDILQRMCQFGLKCTHTHIMIMQVSGAVICYKTTYRV